MSPMPDLPRISMLRPSPTVCLTSRHSLILSAVFAPALLAAPLVHAQNQSPIAVVPLDSSIPGAAASVTGVTKLTQGTAILGTSGTITAGRDTAKVVLPGRGTLSVCATTAVRLTVNRSVSPGETPGLLVAMDQGAVEASFNTGSNSDMLITPDFRILISGSGATEVKVRLGLHGDTCVDNASANSPDVLVTSVFDGGAYSVRSGQRVMFQHGSTQEVVDQEKESCGCPPAEVHGNEFPLAQSEGLAPGSAQPPSFTVFGDTRGIEPLSYNSADHVSQPGASPTPTATAKPKKVKKPNSNSAGSEFFESVRHFFRHLFGLE